MSPYEIAVIVAVACLGFAVLMAWWSSDRVAKATEETEKAWGVADERGDAITELEAMVINLTDRNERLHADQRRMRERLPSLRESLGIAEVWPAGGAEFWSCGTEGHTKVEWRGNVAHCADCGRSSADVVDEDVERGIARALAARRIVLDDTTDDVDPDVTRPYTEVYEAGDGR
jgi:hypothetical protein